MFVVKRNNILYFKLRQHVSTIASQKPKKPIRKSRRRRGYHKKDEHISTLQSFSKHISTVESSFVSALDGLKSIDKRYNYKGHSPIKYVSLFAAAAVLVSLISAYGFREEIKENIGVTGAEITSITLGDAEVQKKTKLLAKQLVYEILNDEKALMSVVHFGHGLLHEKRTQQAAAVFFAEVLQNEKARTEAGRLFQYLFNDPHVMNEASKLMAYVLSTEACQREASQLGIYVMKQVLDDEEVYKKGVEWASAVFADEEFTYQASDTMWSAMKQTFVPRLLRKRKEQQLSEESKESGEKVEDKHEEEVQEQNIENQNESKEEERVVPDESEND
eukprot:augustus_masked-scaffold_1-processed-gene-5.49-mRNA-1 protein AED:1.00 eAED:1.00 QI:0/-1/0/0/-1/1/1/0/331